MITEEITPNIVVLLITEGTTTVTPNIVALSITEGTTIATQFDLIQCNPFIKYKSIKTISRREHYDHHSNRPREQ